MQFCSNQLDDTRVYSCSRRQEGDPAGATRIVNACPDISTGSNPDVLFSGETGAAEWVDRYGSEPRKGADILVQALEREGVGRVFAYPGGASMEIHQALTRSPIRNILCRHEQVRPICPCLSVHPDA